MIQKYKHFIFFYLGAIALNCIFYLLIAEHFKQLSETARTIRIIYFFYPILLSIAMILTYSSEKRLDYLQRTISVVILITLQILTTICMNLINIYERVMTSENVTTGIENEFMFGSVQLVLLLLIIIFVKSRVKK